MLIVTALGTTSCWACAQQQMMPPVASMCVRSPLLGSGCV